MKLRSSINVTPTTNTIYTVTATDNNCTATDDVDVNVTPNPAVDLGIDVAICQGDSTLLDAGSGHTNYLWNTGETTQTIYADTAGTYSVTVGNGTPISNSNSLSFDPVSGDYINISDNPTINSLDNQLTIMGWVNTNGDLSGENPRIINRSEGLGGGTDRWNLSHSPNEKIVFNLENSSIGNEVVTGNTSMNIGEWYFISAVFNSGQVNLYLNGQLDGSGNMTLSSLSHVQNVVTTIGSTLGDNSFGMET